MKLYVGNIPYDATEVELRQLFTEFEPVVDFFYPMDRDTGRPRGFAFVTLNSREDGETAIRNLDGSDFAGRKLRVNEAQDQDRGGRGGGGRGGRGGGGGGGGGGRDRW